MVCKRGHQIVDTVLLKRHLHRIEGNIHVDVGTDAVNRIVVVNDGRGHVAAIHLQGFGHIAFIRYEGEHGRGIFIEVCRPRFVSEDDIAVDVHLTLS